MARSELFEVYMDNAYRAVQEGAADVKPPKAELIKGLEAMDFAGRGGAPVTQAVISEATTIGNALMATWWAREDSLVDFENPIPSRYKVAAGWHVTTLDETTSYSDGRVKKETDAGVILIPPGLLCVYRPAEEPEIPMNTGTVFNMYAPVCSTRINDRSVLYGFAEILVRHEVDPFPQPKCI
jgi:hypothetical protein